MKSNKWLPISIIVLAFALVISSVIITMKQPTATFIDSKENSEVLVINEVADYLQLSEEQVMKMINIETTKLEEDGSFSGMMIPYFTVDEKYYFSKSALDHWLKEVTTNHTAYNTSEGWISK